MIHESLIEDARRMEDISIDCGRTLREPYVGGYPTFVDVCDKEERQMKCPCKGCTDRWASDKDRCHSTCEKYLSWKKEYCRMMEDKIRAEKARSQAGALLFRIRKR